MSQGHCIECPGMVRAKEGIVNENMDLVCSSGDCWQEGPGWKKRKIDLALDHSYII